MNFLRRFMSGRYGPDQLFTGLLIASIVISLLSNFINITIISSFLGVITWALLIFAVYRLLSRNIDKRQHENDVFLRYWAPVQNWFKFKWRQLKDCRTYRYFRCPGCGNTLRVPKGKGKINITCPKCKMKFEKKS